MNKNHAPIGIFGGTFDPIHDGHLRAALEILQKLQLKEVRFVPCKKPVHEKVSHAHTEERLAMVKSAIKDIPGLCIDDREILRETPSYMVTTLESLREELGKTPIFLILGVDAFAKLDSWHQWEKLIELSHIIVINRPGHALPQSGKVVDLMKQYQTNQAEELYHSPAGKILFLATTPLDISSTQIRNDISAGKNTTYLIPDEVYDYIRKHHLYLS